MERSGDCFLWTGGKSKSGYGCIQTDGRTERTHRIAYKIFVGPVDIDEEVCHTCDNPLCMNLDHLFIDDHQGNMDDMVTKSRQARHVGESNHLARFSNEQAEDIRLQYARGEVTQKELADLFNTSKQCIHRIVRGKSYVVRPAKTKVQKGEN